MPCDMTSVKISGIRSGREKGRHAPYRVPEAKAKSAPLFFPHANITAPPTPSSDTSSLMSPPFSTPSLTSSPTISTCSSMRTTPGYEVDIAPERSSRKRSARKSDDDHVRRPANPFILFACEFRNQPHHKGINNRVLSKKAGELWKLMSDAEKQAWRVRASAVKRQHEQDHPDYRYQPRRRKQRSSKKSDYPMNLTFPDPPKSPVPSKVEETDSLRDKALRFPSPHSEDRLLEDATLTELSQRKHSSRGPVGLDANFFAQSKLGLAIPAEPATLLPDLTNMQSLGSSYNSLQWHNWTIPSNDYQWNALGDPTQALWNDFTPFGPADTSLLDSTSLTAFLQSQNQFTAPSFLNSLSA